MTTRHIAFYMHDLSGGGVERMRLALIAQLRARGTRVTLILAARSGPLGSRLPHDLPVVEIGMRGMLGNVLPLARMLRRIRPDILVASLDHNNVTALLASWVSGSATRIVICQHNALSAERALGWRYRLIPWLYWLLQRGADGVVAVSNGVADDLARVAGIARANITPIYNPIIGPDFAERMAGASPHPWLDDTNMPVFVFAGRLTSQKDPATLLEAMAGVLQCRSARLIVLGEGPLLAGLQDSTDILGIADHVAFVGYQINPLPWIRHASALVCTSRYEGLGNTLIEALACGIPVIATNCPHGPSEVLLGGKIGRLVAVGDAAGLAQAMLALLRDVPDRAALTARAASFTVEACAEAHEALFARLLRRHDVDALGLRLSPLCADEILVHITRPVRAECQVQLVVTPNLDHVRLLRRPEFAAACRAAAFVSPDGFPVLLYARLCGLALGKRVTGCALFHRLAAHPSLRQQSLFFVVESQQTASAITSWAAGLKLENLHVAVARPRLASDSGAQGQLAARIRAVRPTILIMTLGAPVSEEFVHMNRKVLPPCWAMCVGQAVRVELGLTSRAPARWQSLGLEWLWRIKQEPRRMVGRYARALAWFPVAIILDLVRSPPVSKGESYNEAGTPASSSAVA